MKDKNQILNLIKDSVVSTAPGATVVLYGSYARGDFNDESDIDLLIRADKDKFTHDDENKITYPLFDIGFKTGMLTSPMAYTKDAWVNHRVTPFYENANKEGRIL